ncbi:MULTISPECIES: metalloregulator ArsR/SmtB family transcription factor [Thiothrix]|jgi:ArsR family transcriptional regulator|uniref:Winged helix-turn-helix transcriptional regulator n=2 Tax=Thiothrix TaxID=1030 RepID=A0A975FAD9_9GAMM|nr:MULTISPECIES: metalloregulator ArsR/SmtB family transcription factor [Thiothrix]OQX09322.1 MAG: transcriptional regulator [Thiothrix lacustris]QTR54340.1 winged helix-turn-helix transcriptional regulator [Thiothrix unzii]
MHHDQNYDLTMDEASLQEKDIEAACRSLKAIAHPLRLKILCVLGKHEMSVQEIVDYVGTSQSNVSQHLTIMREKGLLHSRKDSNRVFYRISENRASLLHACSSFR